MPPVAEGHDPIDVPNSIGEPGRRKNRPKLTRAVKRKVLMRDGYTCQTCGTQEDLTIDHRIPLVKGGSNAISNLQVLCRQCNLTKGADSDGKPRRRRAA